MQSLFAFFPILRRAFPAHPGLRDRLCVHMYVLFVPHFPAFSFPFFLAHSMLAYPLRFGSRVMVGSPNLGCFFSLVSQTKLPPPGPRAHTLLHIFHFAFLGSCSLWLTISKPPPSAGLILDAPPSLSLILFSCPPLPFSDVPFFLSAPCLAHWPPYARNLHCSPIPATNPLSHSCIGE